MIKICYKHVLDSAEGIATNHGQNVWSSASFDS